MGTLLGPQPGAEEWAMNYTQSTVSCPECWSMHGEVHGLNVLGV